MLPLRFELVKPPGSYLICMHKIYIILAVTCADEEVERAYEEFYEDVHTEFLKFGEIVNFKVCRNGSSHLRGNVYVHYKSLDSAVLSHQSINGRYFAGKQMQCEFVGVTRWRVAICGEFMKSKLMTCSRGMTCNFIHCFRNPGGDYEWADWDKPPPRYWMKKMVALFGCCDDSAYEMEQGSPIMFRKSSRISIDDVDRYHTGRSQSRENVHLRSSRNYPEDDIQSNAHRRRRKSSDRERLESDDENRVRKHSKYAYSDSDSDNSLLERERSKYSRCHNSSRKSSKTRNNNKLESQSHQRDRAHIYTEKSRKSDGYEEESGNEKTDTSRAHKKRNREVENDSGEPSKYGPRHKSSSSRPKKDSSEQSFSGRRSNRKRDHEKKFDSECRIEFDDGETCHITDYHIDENDDRGRWEA